jgi:hypothetical protein
LNIFLKNSERHKIASLVPAIFATGLLLAGCDNSRPRPAASSDIAGLREIIHLEIPAASAQWEIFGTPEYHGGTPGPTDFVTLVAQLQPVPKEGFNLSDAAASPAYIVPEAARPWLIPAFRAFLDENRNSNADMAAHPECRRYLTSMKKTGQKVAGFACAQADKVLLYITLSSPQ